MTPMFLLGTRSSLPGNSALFSGGDFGSCGSRWRRQGAANEAGGLRETTGDVVVGFTGWQFLTLCELENPYGNYGLVIFGRYIYIDNWKIVKFGSS